jgi:hypothetical protein
MAEMQAAIDKAIADDREEWLRDTGRPMPMNARQLVIEAGVAGISREDIAQAEERAQKTGDRFGYEEVKQESTVAKILRDQHIADEITVQVAVAERLAPASEPTVSDDTRIAIALTMNCRKVLAALDEWGVHSLGDSMTRKGIEERTHLSDCEVRNVMERELPRQVVALVATKTGPGGGVWLTPEGAAVASAIDKKILPSEVTSAAGKKH